MPGKKRYVVAEIGPGFTSAPSWVFDHANKLRRKVHYIALDPQPNPAMRQQTREQARETLKASFLKYTIFDNLPLKENSVDELHVHCLASTAKINLKPIDLIQQAKDVLKTGGKLFVSARKEQVFFNLTRMSRAWFEKHGFKVEQRATGRQALRFSMFIPNRLIVLQKR